MSTKGAGRLTLSLLLIPFLLWISLLIILPHVGIVALSLREKIGPRQYTYGLSNYGDFVREPIYWNTLLRTAMISVLVTTVALVVAFPVAYYIAKIAKRRTRAALF